MAAERFCYPQPVELARGRAEKAREAGQATAALWGSVGGLLMLERHGREHFRRLARRRWGR